MAWKVCAACSDASRGADIPVCLGRAADRNVCPTEIDLSGTGVVTTRPILIPCRWTPGSPLPGLVSHAAGHLPASDLLVVSGRHSNLRLRPDALLRVSRLYLARRSARRKGWHEEGGRA